MDFSPRDLHDVLGVVDERIARAARRQPRTEYGSVSSVSTDGNTASVKLLGSADASAGFRVPPTFRVAVNDYVRVMLHPNGDRYVDENLTAERHASPLVLDPENDTTEGGSIHLKGAGANPLWEVDAYEDDLRMSSSGTVHAKVSQEGRLSISGYHMDLGARMVQVHEIGAPANTLVYVPDADIPRGGAALMSDDGNSGVAIMHWYRSGSFNTVNGTGVGPIEFRGTTYSAGTADWSFFIENNNAGARLAVQSNQGFDRTWRLLILA